MHRKNKHLILLLLFFTHFSIGQNSITIKAHTDSTFGAATEQKLRDAVSMLNKVLNTHEFKQMVLEENFNVGNNGLSSQEIYNLFVDGSNNYINGNSDGKIDFHLSIFDEPFKKHNNDNFGVTDMRTRITRTHRCFILNNDTKCYVSHLMHEYMHQIGFIDKRRFLGFGKKTSSVPYKIGRIIDKLIGNSTPCLAQQGTCTI